MKRYLLVLALLLPLIPGVLFSQTNGSNAEGPGDVIRCYTTENEALRHQNNPNLPNDAAFESWMAEELLKREQNPSAYKASGATRVIPTVVHVIYSNATENISDAQVLSQIQILNDDFQRLNADAVNTPAGFLPVAADCDVEFCLAAIDPSGNPTNGINRVSLAGSPFTTNYVDNTIKPSTIWDPNQYFNIWVCNVSGGVLGWAQFPEAGSLAGIGTGNGAANTDGVVLLYTSVGAPPANPFPGPYNAGRTATHEVGHWLGLRHIWGDGNCGVDDFCNDTPESDAANFGCPTTHVSCSTTDMVQNYMDYTDDACMNIFTQDQKSRIDIVLSGSPRRASLLTSTVCYTSPVISFASATTTLGESSVSGNIACRGYQDVNIDLRIGGPPTGDATVNMTVGAATLTAGVDYDIITGTVVFPDGVVATQSFVIRLYDDGAVETAEDLNLGFTISGSTDATSGSPNTHVLTLMDNDQDPSLGSTATLFFTDFEGGAAGWTTQNNSGTAQWALGGAGGMNGSQSMYISRDGGATHTYDRRTNTTSRLVSPAIDATGFTGMTLSFDWHCNGESGYDYGTLLWSLDGTNWNTLSGTSTGPFVASASNSTFTIGLPVAVENNVFYLGWQWQNDNSVRGNPPFAVDDVLITAAAPIPVEDVVTSTDDQYLGPNSTVYWYDNSSGDLIARIDNPTGWDYGCTSITIDRSGSSATVYETPNMPYAVTDKTFLVTPANNNPGGSYTIRLYFTASEVAGWEAATGQARSNMNIAKTSGPISNITPATPLANGTGNVYGSNENPGVYSSSDFWVEADFSSGFSGFAGGVPDPGFLPVYFNNISAVWQGKHALVSWEVGTLDDLDYFELERMVPGENFQSLAEIRSYDNKRNFEYLDARMRLSNAEAVYYRVRSHHTDGSETLSEVRQLRPDQELAVNVFPNPFQDGLNVVVQLEDAAPITVTLTNVLGQELQRIQTAGTVGSNTFTLGKERLNAGIYFVKVVTSDQQYAVKVTKK